MPYHTCFLRGELLVLLNMYKEHGIPVVQLELQKKVKNYISIFKRLK